MVAFSGLSVDTAASGYTIAATGTGLSTAISNPIKVVPATPTQLVVTVPPPLTMTAGDPFGLAIAVEDQYNNVVTDYTGQHRNRPGG